MVLALPKLRWLVIGAVAAGIWVVREDMKAPRPPERVKPPSQERSVRARPTPPKPLATKPLATKPAATRPAGKMQEPAKTTAQKPVPPKSVAGKPAPQKAEASKTAPALAAVLPRSVDRPPEKPQKLVTGSVARPDKPAFVQTTAKVRMRAQARTDAAVIAELKPRTVLRELARTGNWRLVTGDGQKGWVHADYLAKASFLPRRPKLPVTEAR